LQVLWNDLKKKKVKDYKLTTVNYGTASAPCSAKRVLADIGYKCKNPLISGIIKDGKFDDRIRQHERK